MRAFRTNLVQNQTDWRIRRSTSLRPAARTNGSPERRVGELEGGDAAELPTAIMSLPPPRRDAPTRAGNVGSSVFDPRPRPCEDTKRRRGLT